MGNCINDIRGVFLFPAIAFRDQGSTLCLEWASAGLVRLTRAPASVQRFSAKISHARKVSVAVIQPFRSINYFKAGLIPDFFLTKSYFRLNLNGWHRKSIDSQVSV